MKKVFRGLTIATVAVAFLVIGMILASNLPFTLGTQAGSDSLWHEGTAKAPSGQPSSFADLAEEFGLWFHVDGAYGGGAALVDELRPRYQGIERAGEVGMSHRQHVGPERLTPPTERPRLCLTANPHRLLQHVGRIRLRRPY